MKLELDQFDPETMGREFPEAGSYHFEATTVEEEDQKHAGSMFVDAEILSGTPANQEGKVHREYFSLKPTAVGKIIQFCTAVGLLTKDEVKAFKERGESPDIDLQKAVGRQFCGKLSPETYEGKTRNKLNFDMWPVNSPEAKGIPLNQGRLAELAEGRPSDSAAGPGVDSSSPFGDAPGKLAAEANDFF